MNVNDVHLRRVGFRNGTDVELAALHAVTTPIEAERGTDQYPAVLDSYVTFARSLPSQFDDHAWLVEASDGAPAAVGFCWSNRDGDPAVMQCDIFVPRTLRRRGIGSLLLDAIRDETAADHRSLLTFSTFDLVPAGDAFALHHGAHIGRVNRTSDLALDGTDWPMVQDWILAPMARQRGYRVEFVDGAFPARLQTDAAKLHQIMQSAPRENLEIGDTFVDEDFIAELDRHLTASGRERWTAFVRDAHGNCVGGTEVTFETLVPTSVSQQNTGIDAAHRGFGLAKWVKAAMLQRIRDTLPSVESIRTNNAFSNEAILSINGRLGFVASSARTEWQLRIEL